MEPTPMEKIIGKWPGNETDEEIQAVIDAMDPVKQLREENAKLRDQLRWRKWPEESPSESGFYLVGRHGLSYTQARYFHAGCNDWDVMWKNFYWMPQIPLPKEGE
jgi:hypothetical protein